MKSIINRSQIDRIEIYQNTHRYYKNKIKQLTGADYVMNAAFFSNKFKPLQTLKVNGKMIVLDPIYNNAKERSYWGFGWNTIDDLCYTQDFEKYKNFICCINGSHDGRKDTMYYNPDVAGSRPRSAMGIMKNGNIELLCDKTGRTPEQARDVLLNDGCDRITVFDGGGSVQGTFGTQQVNSSENKGNGRIVYSYILIYLKKNKPVTPAKPTTSNPYPVPTRTLKMNCNGNDVKWLQYQLNLKIKANLPITGNFYTMTKSAVIAFQKTVFTNKKDWDGIVGAQTRAKLMA